jgi:menaquinone-dependent protoporphyrinogen oxidase
MKVLIIYGTTEGQTRKISLYMESVLLESGIQVTLADAADSPPSPDAFDGVIIGASIHMHKYQSSVAYYISKNYASLNKRTGAFFSVCLALVSDLKEEHEEAEKVMSDFLDQAGWKPQLRTQIAGALKYTEYDFFKRLIMKMISKKQGRSTDTSKDFEYTDWNQVRDFVRGFVEDCRQHQVN